MPDPTNIIQDLKPLWSVVEYIGLARERQKRGMTSSNLWRGDKSTHVIGVAGELLSAITLKLPFDAELSIKGDGGYDLVRENGSKIDIKTVSHWSPILKHPVSAKFWPDEFGLVYVDENKQMGILIGIITKEVFLGSADQHRFRSDGPLNWTLSRESLLSAICQS